MEKPSTAPHEGSVALPLCSASSAATSRNGRHGYDEHGLLEREDDDTSEDAHEEHEDADSIPDIRPINPNVRARKWQLLALHN